MEIRVVAYGIARDIILASKIQVELETGATVGTLKNHLTDTYPDFMKLNSLMFARDEEYVDDLTPLNNLDEIVIIPPVSGG